MSLFSEIKNQANALNVFTQCLKTTAKNISNLTNENYAKESVSIAQAGTIQIGSNIQSMGIVVKDIKQSRDSFLDKEIHKQTMSIHALKVEEELARILELKVDENIQRTGDPTTIGSLGIDALNTNGLSSFIDNFFNSLQELSGNPVDTSNKEILLSRAACLCEKFRQLAQNFSALDERVESYKNNTPEEVNYLLAKLADINNQIILAKGNKALGADLDYINQRQATLEELAQYIHFEVKEEPNPTPEGQPIYKLMIPNGTPEGIVLVQNSKVFHTLHYREQDREFFVQSPQNEAAPVTILGGRLNGYSRFQDDFLKPFSERTNTLAQQLTKSINQAYGDTFFEIPADLQGPNFGNFGAKDMQLNPNLRPQNFTTGTREKGSNEILIKMIETYSYEHSQPDDAISGTFQEHYRNTLASFGEKLHNLSDQVDKERSNEVNIKNRRDSLIGVSLDEETANMSLFQKAYNATANVIGLLNSLLDTIINLGKR